MAVELTSGDYAVLIVLKAEGRELSNTEMGKSYGVRLVSPVYEKLNAAGYVVTETKRRPYRHTLTERGEKLLADPLAIDEDKAEEREKRTVRERWLWAALVAQQNRNVRGGATEQVIERSQAEPVELQDRIRVAYSKLAGTPGDWVELSALRPSFADVSRAELDKALVRMLDAPDVRLEPETHRHRIGAEERDASVRVGGEARHKLAIGLP